MNQIATTAAPSFEDRVEAVHGKPDAGIKARAAVAGRKAAYAAKRTFMLMVYGCIFAGVLLAAAVGYYGYTTFTKGHLSDYRPCSADVGGIAITGTRTFSYSYNELFGFRWFKPAETDEKTIINVTGNAMQIIGLTGTKHWWGVNIDTGERGQQILKPADSIVFIIGKKMNAVEYKSFCQ